MIAAQSASLDAVIWRSWRFDQIEVTGSRATGEPVSLSIPGEWLCEFLKRAQPARLAAHVARIVGPGMYGLRSARKLGFGIAVRGCARFMTRNGGRRAAG